MLPRGVEVGRPEFHRAHSQGPITGAEFGEGILLAPKEVNRHLQLLGIEQFIYDINLHKDNDVVLYLTTETKSHTGTLALKSIRYRLEAARGGSRERILFEAQISVGPEKIDPRITIEKPERLINVEEFLRPLPNRKKP